MAEKQWLKKMVGVNSTNGVGRKCSAFKNVW